MFFLWEIYRWVWWHAMVGIEHWCSSGGVGVVKAIDTPLNQEKKKQFTILKPRKHHDTPNYSRHHQDLLWNIIEPNKQVSFWPRLTLESKFVLTQYIYTHTCMCSYIYAYWTCLYSSKTTIKTVFYRMSLIITWLLFFAITWPVHSFIHV